MAEIDYKSERAVCHAAGLESSKQPRVLSLVADACGSSPKVISSKRRGKPSSPSATVVITL
jgi:hypothetical protein